MSQKEMNRLDVIEKLLAKKWTQEKAAQHLRITVRHVQKLMQNYHLEGSVGLISKRRGKPSNFRIPDIIKNRVISLIKRHYVDFGPTLASEKLLEKHE